MTSSLLIASAALLLRARRLPPDVLAAVPLAGVARGIGQPQCRRDADAEHHADARRHDVRRGAALGRACISASATWTLPAAGALFLAVRTVVQPFQFSMRNTPSQAITVIFALGALIHAAAAWSLWK